MFEKFSVKAKVLFALLTVTIITSVTVGLIALGLGITTLKVETYKKLVSVREFKAGQVENYFKSMHKLVINYSRGSDLTSALNFYNHTGIPDPDFDSITNFRNLESFAGSFGFTNLYLVNDESGIVLFSVNPDVKAGTSLNIGTLSKTFLAKAYRMAAISNHPDSVFQTDFQPFEPSGNSNTSFFACPVWYGNKKSGVLILQFSIDQINSLITDGGDWTTMGLGQTGETCLVGEERLMRNQSRLLAEKPIDYFSKIKSTNISDKTISRIREANSAIGLLPFNTQEIRLAFQGEAGTGLIIDYLGNKVFAAYKHLNVNNINWVIVSKIDRREVFKSIRKLLVKYLLYIIILFLVIIPFSIAFARDLSQPVEALAIANEQLNTQSAAIKSAANGIIITDLKGVVQWVNPAFTRLTGYEMEDMVGHGLNILNSGAQTKEFFTQMWKKILAGEVWHDEVVNKRKDGTLYTEEMTITPVHDSAGKISQFVAIKHDITERKRLEQIVKSANLRMEGELNVARDIQMSMLPLKFPAFPDRQDIDVFAKLIPAREVGGDFYDFFFIDEENFCFVIGDVSGKGVPAALFMAVTKALLKAGASNERSTAKILAHVNNEISRDNENSMFITVFMAILNTTTGYLVYTNAGHNPPFLLSKAEEKPVKLSDLHGMAIGVEEGIDYAETVLQINRGDSIFSYTDGVTEAQNEKGKLFSEKKLSNLLSNYPFIDCKNLVTNVLDDVIQHENGAEHADDITLMTIHFKEQTADSVVDFLYTSLSNKLENIGPLIANFEVFAGKHNIATEIVQKIDIVFDELLSNTILYAYQDASEHIIEVKIRFYKEKLTVTIMDDGIRYNPFDRSDPDTSLALDDREIGGLGVHLVKLLVDDYHYEYKNQVKKNITTFKKRI
jgi:sigma-B regulation protein RsbU (phosphoserine phosphatase)